MAVTQEELYAGLDLELSWSERALPEHVRTKHVHRLHPYHGKFIPQLVDCLLMRVKTAHHDVVALGEELHDVCARLETLPARGRASDYVRR